MEIKRLIKYAALITFLVFWFLLLSISGPATKIKDDFMLFLPRLMIALITILGIKLAIDLSQNEIEEFLDSIKVDSEIPLRVFRFVLWLFGFLFALAILVEDLGTFVMSLGLMGFGLTFAMRTPLNCFVAWVMIVTRKPFKVNDRVRVGTTEGDVIDITVMYTVLREVGAGGTEPTGRIITFPNEMILTEFIMNYTMDTVYIWDEMSVSVTYESNRELAETVLKECTRTVVGDMMKKGADVMRSISQRKHGFIGRGMGKYIHKTPQIRVSLSESCFDLNARYIVEVRARRRIKTEISRMILDKFRETDGIEIAYPHLELVSHDKGVHNEIIARITGHNKKADRQDDNNTD